MSFEKVPNFLLNFFEAEVCGNQMPSYRFNSFLLDVTERRLSRDDIPVSLTPKAFDVLVYLVDRGGHLVLKDELMQAVWPDSFVDEVNIPRTVHTIRSRLGEYDNGTKFIETVPTKGYRFVAAVEQVGGNGSNTPGSERNFDLIQGRHAGVTDDSLTDDPKKGYFAQSRSRTILVLTVTAILTVSVTGFWFANRFGPADRVFRGLDSPTISGDAFENYRQGRLLMERGHDGDFEAALASFEHAIEVDPNYAGAYAGKADAKTWIFWRSKKPDDVIQARTAIAKALELENSNSYAHTLLCRVKATYEWDFKGAERECRLAMEFDPNDQVAHRETAFLLNSLGREDEAMREVDAAIALAPTSFNKRSRGVILYYSRRYDEAIAQLRQVEETDTNEYDTGRWLMNAYEMKKDYSSAQELRLRQMEFDGANPEVVAEAKATFDNGGWPGVLRSMIDTDRGKMLAAAKYAQLGDKEKAFELLEAAFDSHTVMLINVGREPRFDPIRNDQRFDVLLKRIGLK
jgi:DNA-binding winged helix-turn-helix (wHTH) protein/tetratricopeptide (TPR) repeat protein